MAAIDSDRWHRLSPHLDDALDVAPGRRQEWLETLRGVDADVAAGVQMMLAEHRALDAERFLEADVPLLPPGATLAGTTIGVYTLTRLIAHGGMGSVWLASHSDGRCGEAAAVKLLHVEGSSGAGVERFARERAILARLAHQNIPRLLDAGTSSAGRPYLVLEYVDGTHVDTYCDQRALAIDARLRLFLKIVAALSHVHANRIVHLDIKSSNVLVTKEGAVKLIDFGIAEALDLPRQSRQAQSRRPPVSALTPRAAAPEQLTDGVITTATDVYALGVLLYELLTGRHPVPLAGLSAGDLRRAIVATEARVMSTTLADLHRTADLVARIASRRATTPSMLRRRLRRGLDAIVATAMRKDPAARYASADACADDVRRSLEGEPLGDD